MRLVAASSVCGTAVLFLTMIAIVVVWILNINSSTTAVNSVAELFRKKQAETASQEIAMILHQMYETATSFADNMIHGGVQREYITVLPPSPETFSHFLRTQNAKRRNFGCCLQSFIASVPSFPRRSLFLSSWRDHGRFQEIMRLTDRRLLAADRNYASLNNHLGGDIEGGRVVQFMRLCRRVGCTVDRWHQLCS